jgi:REP element-mobilizing transposase RayT
MAYLPRYAIIWDGAIFHVTWQCHNHSWLLQYDWTKQLYYDLLLKYKDQYKVCFYSYHFMDNHIHLSGKILGTKEQFSALFQVVNCQIAKAIVESHDREEGIRIDRETPCS